MYAYIYLNFVLNLGPTFNTIIKNQAVLLSLLYLLGKENDEKN